MPAPIKELSEKDESDVSSEGLDSLKKIDDSMSILDCSLNIDPEYTSNNAYIDHKAKKMR